MTIRAGDVLIRGARVVPVGGGPTPVEPVDIRLAGGLVADVARSLHAVGARILEADGRWVIPGLWDHHVHMSQWAQTRERVDLAGSGSAREVITRVTRALSVRGAEVVIGYGYRSGTWSQPASVALLDEATGERPVVLVSGDGHNGWLNSAASRLLEVAPREGVIEESDWYPVWARLDHLPRDDAAHHAAYERAVLDAAARGVVGITDMELARGFADWPRRYAAGIDRLRVRAATYADSLDEVIDLGLRSGDPLPGTAGLATMGPLKVITDGSLNTRTAYCYEPYAAGPAPRGTLNIGREELTELMRRARESGLDVAAHAIGDAALASALDAFTSSEAAGSVEHAQLATRADLDRMAALGLVASVQPAHLLDDREVTAALWPDRAERCFMLRSMLDAGVRLAFGSDAPVAHLDPWLAMAAAVHRGAHGQDPWNPAESITARQALAASTGGVGAVRAGIPADLALLDADPLAPQVDTDATADHLRGMQVALTVVAGRVTHDVR